MMKLLAAMVFMLAHAGASSMSAQSLSIAKNGSRPSQKDRPTTSPARSESTPCSMLRAPPEQVAPGSRSSLVPAPRGTHILSVSGWL